MLLFPVKSGENGIPSTYLPSRAVLKTKMSYQARTFQKSFKVLSSVWKSQTLHLCNVQNTMPLCRHNTEHLQQGTCSPEAPALLCLTPRARLLWTSTGHVENQNGLIFRGLYEVTWESWMFLSLESPLSGESDTLFWAAMVMSMIKNTSLKLKSYFSHSPFIWK